MIEHSAMALISARSFIFKEKLTDSQRMNVILENVKAPFSGFEISLGSREFINMPRVEIENIARIIENYPIATLHCGSYADQAFGGDPQVTDAFLEVVTFLAERTPLEIVAIHANDIGDFDLPTQLPSGLICTFEMMGSFNSSHNRFADARQILDLKKGWHVTLDTAHVAEMAVKGEPDLPEYLETLPTDIAHIHFSSPENPYRRYRGFEGLETQHSLAVLCPEFIEKIKPCLPRLRRFPITLEGVTPASALFFHELDRELRLFSPVHSSGKRM